MPLKKNELDAVRYFPHIYHILNHKNVLSQKLDLSTVNASQVHVLQQKPTRALIVCEKNPTSQF